MWLTAGFYISNNVLFDLQTLTRRGVERPAWRGRSKRIHGAEISLKQHRNRKACRCGTVTNWGELFPVGGC